MAKAKGGMDTSEILRYAAIGAAVWFGYRWAVSMGYIDDVIGIAGDVVPQLPAGNGQEPANAQPAPSTGGSTPGQNTQPGGSGGAGGDVKQQVWEAAKGEAESSGGLLHFWQWNYYLPGHLAKVDPFSVPASQWPSGEKPVDAAQVQATPLTLDQWWAMVKGPMGLGQVGQLTPDGQNVNHWGQQASLWYGGEDTGSDGGAGDMGVGRF